MNNSPKTLIRLCSGRTASMLQGVMRMRRRGALDRDVPVRNRGLERPARVGGQLIAMVNPGLCASCSHAEVVTSARKSVFSLCRLSFEDSRFPKYPPLPVIACPGYDKLIGNAKEDGGTPGQRV